MRSVLLIPVLLLGIFSGIPAQAEDPPPATPERRGEYTRRLEESWREVDAQRQLVPEKLHALLAGEGLAGPSGAGPDIAVAATSPLANEILLTALEALQRKGFWRGHVVAFSEPLPPQVSTLLVVGITNQLPGPMLTIHKPFLSSLEVVDIQVTPAHHDHTLFFTELSLAAQLFQGSDDIEFRLERLGKDHAKFSLKSYDRASHQAFLNQLQDFLKSDQDADSQHKVVVRLSKPFLEGLPERSSALQLRSMLAARYPQQWYDAPRMDFFESVGSAVPVAPTGTQNVALWMSEQFSGPEAAEKLFYSLLELLDSNSK